MRQQEYNDIHGYYFARVEHIFGRLWHWGLVRNIWRGGADVLHQSIRILLHLTQFCIRRQVQYPPCGPWPHVPDHVWSKGGAEGEPIDVDNGDDDAFCALCCHKKDASPCPKCELPCYNDCLDKHTCDKVTIV